MTEDPLNRPFTVTLTLGQVFAIRDLIGEALEHAGKPSPAASHHSAALRAVHETLGTALRNDVHDG